MHSRLRQLARRRGEIVTVEIDGHTLRYVEPQFREDVSGIQWDLVAQNLQRLRREVRAGCGTFLR